MAALLRRDMSKPELNDWLHSILHYQNVLRLRRAAITYLPYPAPNALESCITYILKPLLRRAFR